MDMVYFEDLLTSLYHNHGPIIKLTVGNAPCLTLVSDSFESQRVCAKLFST
jgi:hypothetical protein